MNTSSNEAWKTCRCCNVRKLRSEFYAEPRYTDGAMSQCKVCIKSRVKRYREKNREAITAKKLLDNNTPAGLARRKRYRQSEKYCLLRKASEDADRKQLGHNYVKRALLGKNSTLKARQIPPDLVEMKRLQLATLRLARQLKKGIKNETSTDAY